MIYHEFNEEILCEVMIKPEWRAVTMMTIWFAMMMPLLLSCQSVAEAPKSIAVLESILISITQIVICYNVICYIVIWLNEICYNDIKSTQFQKLSMASLIVKRWALLTFCRLFIIPKTFHGKLYVRRWAMALPTGHWTTLAPATIKGNMALIAFRTQISNIFKCQNQILKTQILPKPNMYKYFGTCIFIFDMWMSNFLVLFNFLQYPTTRNQICILSICVSVYFIFHISVFVYFIFTCRTF